MIIVTNGPTSLVSVVNTSYCRWVFHEGTGIVSDIAEKDIVCCRYWFDVIVNLLSRIDLLMYAKPISLLVDSNNVYRIVFYQLYLLSWLTTPPPFLNLVM